jgi:hypothetical protein
MDGPMALAAACLPQNEELTRAFVAVTQEILGGCSSPITLIRIKVNAVLFTLIIIRVNDW